MRARLLFCLFAASLAAPLVQAYTYTGTRWNTSTITMQLQLGGSGTALSDGSVSWGAAAEDALATWNAQIGATRFVVVRDSTAAIAKGNRLNNVHFSPTVYGEAWGSGVLAVAITYSSSGAQAVESDVLFNQNLRWDSYRGATRYSGGTVYDFRRVAMHEFGHVLGLDHPDQDGQTVTALMNSRVSNLDTLAPDDISGVQSLYGPPRAETVAPAITTQPASQTVTAGVNVSFSVVASGTAPFTYQWRKAGVNLAGATSASLALGSVTAGAAGQYSVVVSNSAGSVTSANATLTVNAAATGPSITTQPAARTVVAGAPATFSVTAAGTGPLGYAWRRNGVAIAGATQSTYSIGAATSGDAGTYTVVVSNVAGSVTSTGAALTVHVPPALTLAPTTQTVSAGERIALSATASGTPAPTFQWQKNGVNVAGATASSLVIAAAAPSDAGTYSVTVTNAAGSVSSMPVLVTVNHSQLVNLSTRGIVTRGGALTAGFFIRGTGDKPILVRGVGPTLSQYGVTNALADPQLALIAQSTAQTVATNDSWGSTPSLSTGFQSVGAFPLPAGSADSASQVRLLPGAYTTRVTGEAALSPGVALTEVYDAEPASLRSRLVNLSTRGYAGTGEQALVAGFTLAGNAPKRLLVRAVGPGLIPYGVTDILVNPRFEVFAQGQPTAFAGNDDWPATTEMKTAFTASGAFPLADASRDAAMVLTLQPGIYTIVVTGVSGTTGNVLIELYDLDP